MIRAISSSENGSVGRCATFGPLTARAGFFAIQSPFMQNRKKARRRSRFFEA
jgi:hypothetical protein